MLMVVNLCQIPDTSDLSSLNRTCKAWYASGLPRLYECVTLQVPYLQYQLAATEYLVTSPCEGIKYIKGLRVVPHHDRHDHEPLKEPVEVGEAVFRQQPLVLGIFKTLLRVLVRRIPPHALDNFV